MNRCDFKVGDKVVAIDQSFSWGAVKKGDEGVIVRIWDSEIVVDFPAQPNWSARTKDLKLIEPKIILPEDLFNV